MATPSTFLMTRSVATNVNQPGSRQFTDPEIKEFLNRALGAVQMGLQSHGVRDIRVEADVTLPALAKSITSATTPALPTGFVSPIRLWEKNGDLWQDMMQSKDHLPLNAIPGERLAWWEWRDQGLRFVGATAAVSVKIHYRVAVTDLAYPQDSISLPNLTEVLIAKASALAAVIAGLSTAQYFEQQYQTLFDQYLSIDAKHGQATGFRRKRRRPSLPVWRY
ncbi:MAG: hypothetical protein IPP07_28750 [Holophagales bacterium]|jgi:hypothetical protein|nr:hypothetical protein [Holophagales bacterium]